MVTIQKVLVKVLRLAFVLALVAATASVVDAATATWAPNPEPDVAGYKLSYGTQPGVHDKVIDVGKVTTFTFDPPSGRYYVVVQAYNTTGELSAKSAEVVVDISATTNRAPTLAQPGNQTSTQNATVSLTLVASDPDGSLLNYQSTGLPPGLSLNAVSGVIAGVVSSAGTYPVTVTVSDGTLSASQSFTWTVTAPAATPNRAPSLVQPADQTTSRNTSVSLALSASDPDGTALSYTATGLPPGLSLNTTSGIIAGIPFQAGSFAVTATVSDGALSASRSFKWNVIDNGGATPTPTPIGAPSLVQPADQTTSLNTSVSLALSASDPDGTALRYTATGLPPGLSLNTTSGIIAGIPFQAGSFAVTATVSDGALSASRSFKWNVIDNGAATPNRAPSLNNVPDQRDKPNASVSLQLRGSDPEGTQLQYSSTGLPPGFTLNATSGLISGVMPATGTFQVTVTVSDGALSASRSFTWTVSASNGKNVVSSALETQDAGIDETALSASSEAAAGVRFQSAGLLSGVTALQDGRLLLIENERSLRMLTPDSAVAHTVLTDSDAGTAFTEVAINGRFAATRHVFVGVLRRIDADTREFSIIRYRELQGALGEGVSVVGGLRFSGNGVPRLAVDDEERISVAMPETSASDLYSAKILSFDADGTVSRKNRVASPVVARGFSQPSNLGWVGPVLVATGLDPQWSYSAGMMNPDAAADTWPAALEPVSLGSSTTVVAAAFGSGQANAGLRAFVDSERRVFRLSVDSRSYENVAIPEGLTPVSAAAGFDGQIYLIARAGTGEFVLLEFPKDIK